MSSRKTRAMVDYVVTAHGMVIFISDDDWKALDNLPEISYKKIEDKLIQLGFLSLPKKFH